MKKLMQLLVTTCIFASLGIFIETKNVVACVANPVPSIKVGDSMTKILQDLLANGNCGERLIMRQGDERTIIVCAPVSGWDEKTAIKLVVHEGVVREMKRTRFDNNSLKC